MGVHAESRRLQARVARVLEAQAAHALAAASAAQCIPLRVYAATPHLEILVDDRGAPLSDGATEGLQRVLRVALDVPMLGLRRLSDEPAWRRDATWARAWAAPAPEAAAAAARDDVGEDEGEAAPPPEATAAAWRVTTATGSAYGIRVDDTGRWWLSGANVPSARSRSIDDGEWRIDAPTPWPPVVGYPLRLAAPAHLAPGDPARVPGGGKLTSAVLRVDPVSDANAPRVDRTREGRS